MQPIILAMNPQPSPVDDVALVARLLHDAELRRDRAKPGTREYHAAAREVTAHGHRLRVARARSRARPLAQSRTAA